MTDEEFRNWNKKRVVKLDSRESILEQIEVCKQILDGKHYECTYPYSACKERDNIIKYIENLEERANEKN